MTKNNAIHGVGLGLRLQGITVLRMMKVAYGEERKQSSWVGVRTMGEHEGRSEFSAILPGDHIHHSGGMFNRVVPKGLWHLLFSEVGTGQVYHDFPI